jgi:hypothetical protein
MDLAVHQTMEQILRALTLFAPTRTTAQYIFLVCQSRKPPIASSPVYMHNPPAPHFSQDFSLTNRLGAPATCQCDQGT